MVGMNATDIATANHATCRDLLGWTVGPVVVAEDGSASFTVLSGERKVVGRGGRTTTVRVNPHTVTIHADGSRSLSCQP